MKIFLRKITLMSVFLAVPLLAGACFSDPGSDFDLEELDPGVKVPTGETFPEPQVISPPDIDNSRATTTSRSSATSPTNTTLARQPNTTSRSANTLPPPPPIPGAPGEEVIYIVESGDTLGSIAERYGISVADIIAANNLENPDILSIGQEIVIPNG